jgi:hypothetical protein
MGVVKTIVMAVSMLYESVPYSEYGVGTLPPEDLRVQ